MSEYLPTCEICGYCGGHYEWCDINSRLRAKKAEGFKDDTGKTRYDLLPFEALEAVARVFTKGLDRPGRSPDNWKEQPMRKFVGASFRHLTAPLRGEDIDQETGEHHWACLGANALILLDRALGGSVPSVFGGSNAEAGEHRSEETGKTDKAGTG